MSSPPLPEGSLTRAPIAYVAGILPSRSETFVYREIRALRDRGWNVHAVSLHGAETYDVDGLDDVRQGSIVVYNVDLVRCLLVEPLKHPRGCARTVGMAALDALFPREALDARSRVKLLAQAAAGISLGARLRPRGVRHIHCHFAHAPTSVAMYAARHLGISFSFTGHANDLFQRRALLGKKLHRAAFVACISRWHRELYRRVEPQRDDKYLVIRCGVDVERWHSAGARHPADSQPLHILSVCRLVEKKGIDTLVRAMSLLSRPAVLTVAGDGPEREALERLANELGCGDRVRFLGSVDNDTVRRLMQEEAHVFVLPCRTDTAGDRDGVPVVLIEAMACQLPVVSGDLPAIRELIDDDVNGVLVPPDDAARLANALERLTDARREELGRAGRAKVEGEFALSVTVQRLEQALESAVLHQPKTRV